MTMIDPLEDTPRVPNGGCGDCDSGWRQVQPAYAHHEALKAGDEGTNAYKQRYASALSTVYPCRVCRPSAFFRWANGHFDPEHDRGDCSECASADRRRAKRPTPGGWSPPTPGDGDERGSVPEPPERKDLA